MVLSTWKKTKDYYVDNNDFIKLLPNPLITLIIIIIIIIVISIAFFLAQVDRQERWQKKLK